jgi:membrane fusion protein
MAATLFRHEVIEARQAQWLGSIRISGRPSFVWVTVSAAALAIGLVSFALLGEVQRKATVPGILLPVGGLVQIAAPQSGVITQWLVREGEFVEQGRPLLSITSERHLASGEAGSIAQVALQQRRSSLESELRLLELNARQREQVDVDRARSLAVEREQIRAELNHVGERVEYAQRNQRRFQELAERGFVSAVQAQQREDELLELLSRQSSVRRSLQSLERELAALRAERPSRETAVRASQEQLRRALAALTQEEAELRARQGVQVVAGKAGIVSTITRAVGHSVQAGQTLLSLVTTRKRRPSHHDGADPGDDETGLDLQAHLFAPSRTAGFVRPGQVVWLRYEAYPYQKFGMAQGTVVHVSDAPLAPEDLPQGQAASLLAAARSNEALLRVTVQLKQQDIVAYGNRWPLRPASTLEADIVQDRRAVWEWLFEPLIAARERMKVLSSSPNDTGPGG